MLIHSQISTVNNYLISSIAGFNIKGGYIFFIYLFFFFRINLVLYPLMVQFASLTPSIATVLLLSLGFNEVAAGKTCVVAKSKYDDAVTITQAFNNCKTGGTVYFPKGNTYYLKSMVSISGVKNVNVNFAGQLVLPPYDSKFKGKESYIEIKGDNIHWSGGGTITGNGQAW